MSSKKSPDAKIPDTTQAGDDNALPQDIRLARDPPGSGSESQSVHDSQSGSEQTRIRSRYVDAFRAALGERTLESTVGPAYKDQVRHSSFTRPEFIPTVAAVKVSGTESCDKADCFRVEL